MLMMMMIVVLTLVNVERLFVTGIVVVDVDDNVDFVDACAIVVQRHRLTLAAVVVPLLQGSRRRLFQDLGSHCCCCYGSDSLLMNR